MKRIALIVALVVTLPPAFALGRDQGLIDAMNNTSHELTICAAYYFVAAGGIRNSGDEATARQYDDAANHAVQLAGVMGEEIGLSEAGFLARLDMAMQEMVRKIDSNYVNISILLRDYSEPCVSLLNNPEHRVAEFLLQNTDESLREMLLESFRLNGILP